jgi:hypothetical protein
MTLQETFDNLIEKYGGREKLLRHVEVEFKGENYIKYIPTLNLTKYQREKVLKLQETTF